MSETRIQRAARIAAALAVLALASGTAVAPAAATDLEDWAKKARVVAPPFSDSAAANPKTFCVCVDDADQSYVNSVGVVFQFTASVGNTIHLKAGCALRSFATNGQELGYPTCDHWTPLRR